MTQSTVISSYYQTCTKIKRPPFIFQERGIQITRSSIFMMRYCFCEERVPYVMMSQRLYMSGKRGTLK